MNSRNKLATLTPQQTKIKYLSDSANPDTKAYYSNGYSEPLFQSASSRLEFIAGLWRFQDEFEEKITLVRGKEFVLGRKFQKKNWPSPRLNFLIIITQIWSLKTVMAK